MWGTVEGFPKVAECFVEEATFQHRSISPKKPVEWAGVSQEAKGRGMCSKLRKEQVQWLQDLSVWVSMTRAQGGEEQSDVLERDVGTGS